MAMSEKAREAAEQVKKAAAGQKGEIEKAAHKAEAFAKEHGEEIRERIADARQHAPRPKGQHRAS